MIVKSNDGMGLSLKELLSDTVIQAFGGAVQGMQSGAVNALATNTGVQQTILQKAEEQGSLTLAENLRKYKWPIAIGGIALLVFAGTAFIMVRK